MPLKFKAAWKNAHVHGHAAVGSSSGCFRIQVKQFSFDSNILDKETFVICVGVFFEEIIERRFDVYAESSTELLNTSFIKFLVNEQR